MLMFSSCSLYRCKGPIISLFFSLKDVRVISNRPQQALKKKLTLYSMGPLTFLF